MPTPTPSPARIMGTATQYWPSALLLGALRLDLFSLIPEHGADSADIALRGGFSPRHLELLLNALAAHEFVERRGDLWFNAPDAEAYLKRGGPAYLGGALGFALDLYEPWGRLHETVREGRPAFAGDPHLRTGAGETARFVRAMHERALAMGPALVADFDLAGCRSLLDLGGGPGTLSRLLARRHPGLQAVVLDLPPVAEQARLLLAESEGPEIRVVGGSYLEDLEPRLGDGKFDAVLLSGQMHQETLADCGRILANARKALEPRGRLFLVDILTEDGKTAPRFAALFGINMSLMRPNGGVHSRREMAESLAANGFRIVRSGAVPLDYPYYYFLAEKA